VEHYLAPLLTPKTVALVGASDQAGSLGRTVYENLLAGSFSGELFAVNPNHRKVFDRRAYATLDAIGKPIDLAIIAAPPSRVPGILAGIEGQVHAVALMSLPDTAQPATGRTWRREVLAAAKKRGIRMVGPGAFGVVRTDIGLNATFCAPTALPGRLALVAQSGAVCTAMLDFAAQMQIGFSTVISLGGGIDVGFGELLDALVLDPKTEGILLYVEDVGDARTFLSALRAAARTKPVVVLKAGRSRETAPGRVPDARLAVLHDTVFEAALRRSGTVRVRNYTQLFAAARILAMGRIPRGERIAIVSNGRGPGLLAADAAAVAGVPLAEFSQATSHALEALLPAEMARTNPVDVRGDAPPARLAAAVAATLSDPDADAILAIHVPRPIISALDAARAVAAVARGSAKPVLAAWLGAINRPEVQEALEAGGVTNFFTPENAVDAFSFLAAYRRNQEWLLEVPPSHAEPPPPDLAAAEEIRGRAKARGQRILPHGDVRALLLAFGIQSAPSVEVETLAEAQAAARKLRYPVALVADGFEPPQLRAGITNRHALARAYGELLAGLPERKGEARVGDVVVRRSAPGGTSGGYAISLVQDEVFGPVIALGTTPRVVPIAQARSVMLAPLNRRLAEDLLAAVPPGPAPLAATETLLRVSAMACALPWLTELVLDPLIISGERAEVAAAWIAVDPKRKAVPGYRHMAIHPYPAELESRVALPDGTPMFVRPVKPEDAGLEQRFVASLSEQTRFFRFFYRLHELTPAMLARFTQVDYDREVALLGLVDDPSVQEGVSIVGIARYITNPDRQSAEFAIVVGDAWQRRGIAGTLMRSLIACARRRGLAQLTGAVLRANVNMLRFSTHLGFVIHDDPEDPDQVTVELALR
jgi:acetyltransferase